MQINRIKKITDKNIDVLIEEHLYRGFGNIEKGIVQVQCMNKDITIRFDFIQETADIDCLDFCKIVPIESLSPKRMMAKIIEATF